MKRILIEGTFLLALWGLSGAISAQLPFDTVQIGQQVWMARNLSGGEGTCYDNDPSNCVIYGALYTWEQAMEACPAGWRLPGADDWSELSEFLGESQAGQQLKASPDNPVPWDGSNASGFTAIPAGAGNGEGFHRLNDWALFWSSTEFDGQRAWFAQLDSYWYPAPPRYKILYIGWYYLKSNQFSVRCIRDENP